MIIKIFHFYAITTLLIFFAGWNCFCNPQPHLTRTGVNLVHNYSFVSNTGWTFQSSAIYDSVVTHIAGSGSVKLMGVNNASVITAWSKLIPITPGKTYTLAAYMRSDILPADICLFGKFLDSSKNYIGDSTGSSRQAVTRINEWQEVVSIFSSTLQTAAYIEIRIVRVPSTYNDGIVWVDDIYFGEEIGFEQAPSSKNNFVGKYVRVDELGNIELWRSNTWKPFFPLCIYGISHEYRDWKLYSSNGFNVCIWNCNFPDGILAAKNATSVFNPDGMMAGFDIAGYCGNKGTNNPEYNKLAHLSLRLNNIIDAGLMENLLFYYWDNENAHTEWSVPNAVINTVRNIQSNSFGEICQPVYQLQGNEGVSRKYNSISDCIGDYITLGAASDVLAPLANYGLIVQGNLEKQTQPVIMGQINAIADKGRMRAAVFLTLIAGGKGIGYWLDEYPTKPIETLEWWTDFPNLRRQVDALVPILREPHWTEWEAVSSEPSVVLGTRNLRNEMYLLVVNNADETAVTHITLSGIAYSPTIVYNYFSNIPVADVVGADFSVILPSFATAVYYLPTPFPATPSNLIVSLTNLQNLTLSWQDLSINEEGFRIERSVNGAPYIFAGSTTSNVTVFTDNAICGNIPYFYRVRATNSTGSSSYVGPIVINVPSPVPPSDLIVTDTNSYSLAFAWKNNATNASGIKLYRSTSGGPFALLDVLSAQIDVYTNTGLTPATSYVYLITATNTFGESGCAQIAASTIEISPPKTPSNLIVTRTNLQALRLSWQDLSINEEGFHIERSINGAPYVLAGVTTSNVTVFTDNSIIGNIPYFYRVMATNSAGFSSYCDPIVIIVPSPAKPTSLVVTETNMKSIILAWQDNATNTTGFKLYRSVSGESFILLSSLVSNARTFSNIGLASATLYIYRITATNTFGESGCAETSVTTVGFEQQPIAPNNLTATGSNGILHLSWTDNSENEEGFRIFMSADGITYSVFAEVEKNICSWTTNLLTRINNFFTVCAYNQNGESASTHAFSYRIPAVLFITEFTAIPNPLKNNINLNYTLEKKCSDSVNIRLWYSESAKNEWFDIPESQLHSHLVAVTNGSYKNTWIFSSSSALKKKIDIKIVAVLDQYDESPAVVVQNVDLSRFFRLSTDLSRATVVNSPWHHELGPVVFVNLPKVVQIKIYTISGKIIQIINSKQSEEYMGRLEWNVTDSLGKKVAPGIYICNLLSERETKIIRVMVKQ